MPRRSVMASIAAAMVIAIALPGCASDRLPEGEGGTVSKSIEGTVWALESWDLDKAGVSPAKAADGYGITLEFGGGRLSGDIPTRRKRYEASYEMDRATNGLTVGVIERDLSLPYETQTDLDVGEGQYVILLGFTDSYAIEGEELVLMDRYGEELLRFTASD